MFISGEKLSVLPGQKYFHEVSHLSDGQAEDVEDASVGKVEGPHQGLTMVGGGR